MAKNNNIPLPILVLIYACLLFAAYISLSTITLGLWGDTVMGWVDSYDSRLDNSNAGVNRSRTVSKGYKFTVNGTEYRGFTMYRSDEAWPRLKEGETCSELISYFPFCPYINRPASLTDFDQMGTAGLIYHLLVPGGCLFLFRLVSKSMKKKKKSIRKDTGVSPNNMRREQVMFCQNCGGKLQDGAAFCTNCGSKVTNNKSGACNGCGSTLTEGAAFCTNCGTAVSSQRIVLSSAAQVSRNAPVPNLIGFSEYCNHPEILETAKKNRKSAIGCMWIMVFVPLIGFPIAGLVMEDLPWGEALVIGTGIALVMLMVNLFALRRTKQPILEGVVTNKSKRERDERHSSEGENDYYTTYMEYTTEIRTDAGKKKKIVEIDSQRDMYDYLAVGDRVRYHPIFGTYEKYDKSKDRIIYCNVCSMRNPIQNDRCKRCNNLLFK